MIKDQCFTEEWLDQFKKQRDHKRIDNIILGKMVYALHLLERLKSNGFDFVFKGGTSLLLLLEEGNRFSIDIDVISKTNREELEEILKKVIDSSHFTEWKLDGHRSYQPGVPKAQIEIAEKLFVGQRTVSKHVSNILDKLHLANRTQAALYALREGLASLDSC